jgi:uncharacterized membrane protein
MRFPNEPPPWHSPWWGPVEWIVPMLVLVLLVGVAVWVILRVTSRPPASVVTSRPALDTAIDRARLRYASGEIDRDAFLQITQDLSVPGLVIGRPQDDPSAPPG